VRALRHGMAGQPGYELFGPDAEGDDVKDAIFEAGKEFGLRLGGARAYSSNTLESGWIPSPMPAIYSGDERMKKYREWLAANSFEGNASLGGSFYSNNIDDYYLTPYDLGYGAFVKFDHEFIGREALEKKSKEPHKIKVTLELNDEDVIKAIASTFGKNNERAKFFDWPSAVYSMYPFDKVLSQDGKLAGVSTWVGYTSNERKFLTLAMLAPEYAKPGTAVTFVWGEENGGSKKPTVESHKQVQIRATVAPVPYVAEVRTGYADGGWRATGKL
jgi:syringate O-demethylase